MLYKYRKLLVSIVMSLLIVSLPASSQIRFGLRQTQGTTWWGGSAELSSLTRKITIHEYFIDVEEDVEFKTSGSPPPNNPNTLEITGTFFLPTQSVVTGVLIWDGDNILKGKLKSKTEARNQYEEVVDRNTSPPPRPRDPIIIEKTGISSWWSNVTQEYGTHDEYRFSIYPVSWGKSRRIRIRYLCPLQFLDKTMVLPIPYSFDYDPWSRDDFIASLQLRSSDNCTSVEVTEKDSSGIDISTIYHLPCTLEQGSGRMLWSNEKQMRIQPSLRYLTLSNIVEDESLVASTSFPDGNWKGNYALFWGTPPDSLLMNAGLRREIVVLWKWNFWNTFVYATDTGKTVSPYGAEVIAQAGKIMELNRTITDAGDRVGLLLEKGSPEQNRLFNLCGKNSETFDTLKHFLGSIDSSYLISTISGTAPPIDIRIADSEKENFFRKGVQSFDVSLKLVCSLFSKHDKVIKHIVLLTAGPVPEMPNLEDFYQKNDAVLGQDITVSAYGNSPRYPTGYWPGVPMYKIVEGHAYTGTGSMVGDIRIPEMKNRRFSITMNSESFSYDQELFATVGAWRTDGYFTDTISVDTVTFAGHSLTPWNQEVVWNAYDVNHTLLATYHQHPVAIEVPQDTFLVKLFAGAGNPVSDTTFASNRGARYGVVDEQYSLLALEEDSIPQSEKEQLADAGAPFLTDNEIFIAEVDENAAAVRMSPKKVLSQPLIALSNGVVRIQLPSEVKNATIRIYNLAGKLVYELPVKSYSGNKQISLKLRGLLGRGVYTISISSARFNFTRKINLL